MRAFTLFVVALLSSIGAYSTDPIDYVTSSIRDGNSKSIATYLGKSVEINMLNMEEIYSKDQGEQILKDFFIKYPPKSYQIMHRGSSENSIYGIGIYESREGKKIRISFNMKSIGGTFVIQELRFEEK